MSDSELQLNNELKNNYGDFFIILSRLKLDTQNLLDSAEAEDWEKFLVLISKRQKSLEELEAYQNRILPESIAKIANMGNGQMHQSKTAAEEFKKVTKVNARILDIISNKKREILNNLDEANKGLAFLKSYRKEINSKKIISKFY